MRPSLERLSYLCSVIPERLTSLTEDELNFRTAPGKWSRKQILGHVIDSAANNHHRFVRGQFEDIVITPYDQHGWNRANDWEQQDIHSIIELWTVYNRHLITVANHISQERLDRNFRTADGGACTLGFLVDDYVDHLEHHLRQIVSYE